MRSRRWLDKTNEVLDKHIKSRASLNTVLYTTLHAHDYTKL